ncbi:MAG: hypothetical protein U1A72_06300 [Sulfuritalea sp.]|nr:hypothetical protein [Sulfuritalea sp.]
MLLQVRVTPQAVRDKPGVSTSNGSGRTVGNKAGRNSESPANIQAILQQAVNIMIGRTLGNASSPTVSPADLEKARIAVIGEAAKTWT